jgi:phosphatidylcholine synthase
MTKETKALSVHLFTATGAVFAMLAMLAAADAKWSLMFLWLIVAFFVDGVDGPLARKYDVKTNAARFDGVLLDLIIDYLTYVFIPAFALFKSGLLPGWTGWIAIIIITFASAMYFCDGNMKTKDNSFHGFPGCWNMVVIVLFALSPNFWFILALISLLAISMFLPVKFVHPVRTGALAGGYASNGDGVGCFRRMGRLGGFSPPKLGPLGADCHINVPCNGGIVSANHPGL